MNTALIFFEGAMWIILTTWSTTTVINAFKQRSNRP